MLKGNEDRAGIGANMPQLHGSCYQVKAKQATGHTVWPFSVSQEWQEGFTENFIESHGVFFLTLISIQLPKRNMDYRMN